MKQILKVGLSSLVLSSFALAGGNEVLTEVKPIVIPSNSFYIGVGVSGINLANDTLNDTLRGLGATLKVGYQYNDYIGVEARYTQNVGNIAYDKGNTKTGVNNANYPSTITNVALYLKPSYKMGDFELYGLLGYGQSKVTDLPTGTQDRTENSFSWGVGVDYALTENISTFIDYTRPYQGTGFDGHVPNSDVHIDLITVGVSYRF